MCIVNNRDQDQSRMQIIYTIRTMGKEEFDLFLLYVKYLNMKYRRILDMQPESIYLKIVLFMVYKNPTDADTKKNEPSQCHRIDPRHVPGELLLACLTSLNYFAIASQIAAPLVVCGSGGATIISGINNNGTNAVSIVWQQRTGDAAAFPSRIGKVGSVPVLPPCYSVPSGHSLIATEIYSGVTTWSIPSQQLLGTAGPSVLYSYSMFEPRFGALLTPQ